MLQRTKDFMGSSGLGAEVVRALLGSAGLRLAGMIFSFLVGVQLARLLGASGYGIYGLALSILSISAVFMQFGIPSLLTREVAAALVNGDWPMIRGVLRWSYRSVIMYSLVIVIATIVLFVIFKNVIENDVQMCLLSGILLMPLVSMTNIGGAALRGLGHIVSGQLPDVVLRPAIYSFLLLMTSISLVGALQAATVMMVHTASAAITFIVATYFLFKALPNSFGKYSIKTSPRSWMSSAVPMAMTEGIRILQGNLSILLLGLISTTASVGIFRVASSVGVLILLPVSLLHVVSAPIISRLYASGDLKRLQRLLKWICITMVLGVTCTSIPFFLVGERLFALVFGSDFYESNVPLMIIAGGTILGSCFGVSVTLLNMTKFEKRVTRSFVYSLMTLSLLLPPFIMFGHINGAALAHSVSFITFNMICWWDARCLLGVDTSVLALVNPSRLKIRNKSK